MDVQVESYKCRERRRGEGRESRLGGRTSGLCLQDPSPISLPLSDCVIILKATKPRLRLCVDLFLHERNASVINVDFVILHPSRRAAPARVGERGQKCGEFRRDDKKGDDADAETTWVWGGDV